MRMLCPKSATLGTLNIIAGTRKTWFAFRTVMAAVEILPRLELVDVLFSPSLSFLREESVMASRQPSRIFQVLEE